MTSTLSRLPYRELNLDKGNGFMVLEQILPNGRDNTNMRQSFWIEKKYQSNDAPAEDLHIEEALQKV